MTLRSVGDLRRRVMSTSLSRFSTLVLIPSPRVPPPTSASLSTTQSRSSCGVSTTPRPRTLPPLFGTSPSTPVLPTLSSSLMPRSEASGNCYVPITQGTGVPLLACGEGGSADKFTEEWAGPLTDFKLVLNGQDRFKAQKGKYFNQVQSLQPSLWLPLPRCVLVLFRAQARGAPAYRHLQLLAH